MSAITHYLKVYLLSITITLGYINVSADLNRFDNVIGWIYYRFQDIRDEINMILVSN
jgi:hypothetical protein